MRSHHPPLDTAATSAVFLTTSANDYAAGRVAIRAADAHAYAATDISDTAARHQAQCAHLSVLYDLVGSVRWPLTVPTKAQIRAAHVDDRETWDQLSKVTEGLTVPRLLEAYDRAQRLSLLWTNSIQRAIAERATEAHIREIIVLRGL